MQLPKQQGLKFLSDLARIWPAVWHTNKKVRVNETLTWGFNGAGDGNRTRVRSLEGFSSTIEPHPRLVGTTGFEPATSCSQSRRATRLRHVPKCRYSKQVRRIINLTCALSMERVTGIEPASEAWKASVLPLNHTRVLALQMRGRYCSASTAPTRGGIWNHILLGASRCVDDASDAV